MTERLDKIQSTGYWRVSLRPTRGDEGRIPALSWCRESLAQSSVHLRGWDYPHVGHRELANGQDWVESGADFHGHVEYWRFYQSGQFVHHFAFEEDYELDPDQLPPGIREPSPSRRYSSILSALYRITEVFEFAARLASKNVLSPEAEISIKLAGTEGRQLFFWDLGRSLHDDYICNIPEITLSDTYSEDELLARADQLALTTTGGLFERFNWAQVPLRVFAQDQANLLERKLV